MILRMHPQSVAGILFSLDRKSILLIKRRDVPVWVLPGGGIDEPESPVEAITREILEETGFTVKVSRLIGDYRPLNRLAKPTHLYECDVLSGSPSLSSETTGIGFFPLTDLPPMPPPYPDWIADAMLHTDPFVKTLTSVTYYNLFKHALSHPILVLRFLLARAGLALNTKSSHCEKN